MRDDRPGSKFDPGEKRWFSSSGRKFASGAQNRRRREKTFFRPTWVGYSERHEWVLHNFVGQTFRLNFFAARRNILTYELEMWDIVKLQRIHRVESREWWDFRLRSANVTALTSSDQNLPSSGGIGNERCRGRCSEVRAVSCRQP